MSLLVRSVDGEPVIEGTIEPVERFPLAVLLKPDPRFLTFDGDEGLITIRDSRGRVVVYRVLFADPAAATAELVSDTAQEDS